MPNTTFSISEPEAASSSPPLTSSICYESLVRFFQDNSTYALFVATEASSHVSGSVTSLLAQPWVYAGGGLGNMDECPEPLHVCLAGGARRDSLTFASVCVVSECQASDLAAPDFAGRVESASFQGEEPYDEDLVQEYVTLVTKISQVNKFLGSGGFVCGNYEVPLQPIPTALYVVVVLGCLLLCAIGTVRRKEATKTPHLISSNSSSEDDDNDLGYSEEKKDTSDTENLFTPHEIAMRYDHGASVSRVAAAGRSFWSAWDIGDHVNKLFLHRPATACLDGLKVLSIFWIISGHVMAIQSSVGPGYLNPATFLPPTGITTTLPGQLLFSSRFAVDTFLCISGYLVVHILKSKLSHNLASFGSVLILRVFRIMPLYLVCLFFWVYVAPYLGSGPFWYQFEELLLPCRSSLWANLLFVQNFLPWGKPTTDTCFYHAWYLAVDMQLFLFLAPLVVLYKRSRSSARLVTFVLWFASVAVTAILTWTRGWSVNTFDGYAVALFDVEGYSKPHVRAQSYLAGMFVAMLGPGRAVRNVHRDRVSLAAALLMLALLSFITVTGAYARRPCNFEELPFLDDCGSTWSKQVTFLYTAFSRAAWSISIGTVIYLCVHQRGLVVCKLLSLRLWTPLAHLSFGAYLIHPIVLFIWQLGGREKISFRLLSIFMDFTSVSVVSFAFSAMASLAIEAPVCELLRRLVVGRKHLKHHQSFSGDEVVPLQQLSLYGTMPNTNHHMRTPGVSLNREIMNLNNL